MKVEVSVSALAGLPAPVGAHELAWSYLLDTVFADAYHARLGTLRLALPTACLLDDVQLRAALSQGEGEGVGVAALAAACPPVHGARRVYRLEFGVLAPGALRSTPTATTGLKLERQLSIYSWRARLYGVPMRLNGWRRRPDRQDRVTAAMRRLFACEGRVPAYYHLGVWSGL